MVFFFLIKVRRVIGGCNVYQYSWEFFIKIENFGTKYETLFIVDIQKCNEVITAMGLL